jgi:catechol 2,3-dioxygenase-like lactoylglutathione lyase family enzyme
MIAPAPLGSGSLDDGPASFAAVKPPTGSGAPDSLNAVTLVTNDMAASVAFYEAVGLEVAFGGPDAPFTTMRIGATDFLNLQLDGEWSPPTRVWGRFIVWVDDVDAVYRRLLDRGIVAEFEPSDAPWGERYFHVLDPAGHELSVARRLDRH